MEFSIGSEKINVQYTDFDKENIEIEGVDTEVINIVKESSEVKAIEVKIRQG